MEALCSGYCILFHHQQPVLQEPLEFPSYSSGSVKAQALQDKEDKMLGKRPLEVVNKPFYKMLEQAAIIAKSVRRMQGSNQSFKPQ